MKHFIITLFYSNMTAQPNSAAIKALALEYKSIQEEPVEGFLVKLMKEDELFEWEVAIFGPPDTPYQGGYFKAQLKFPSDYPYSPPSMKFLTKVWHPNVYDDGNLCISILHPSGDDPQSGELPCERWNPTQNARTILLSVISLLNEPNTSSPANPNASKMYREWKESKGNDTKYVEVIKKQVAISRLEAVKDNVEVPLTKEEYCIKSKPTVEESTDKQNFDDSYVLDDDFDYVYHEDDADYDSGVEND